MATITQIQTDKYSVSDGRSIIKEDSNWYVMSATGESDFGPAPTLSSAKEYVMNSFTTTQKNLAEDLPKQPLTADEQKANKGPAMLWAAVMVVVCVCLLIIRNY